MNPEILLKMLGINPAEIFAKLEEFISLAKQIDARLERIEQKIELTHGLTEALHDKLPDV